MTVRAKCRVTARKESNNGGHDSSGQVAAVEVTLMPVYGGEDDKANGEWSKWTPSGELRLTITNPDAYKQFEIGKSYFVDFTPAD